MTEEVKIYLDKLRDLEKQMLELLDQAPSNSDGRWKSIAKTHFQEGSMAAVRSVTQLDGFLIFRNN